MLPVTKNYQAVPSVVPAGEKSEICIIPTERAFLFHEGTEYRLCIVCADDDETNYIVPTVRHYVDLEAHEGVLKFSYVFEREQEYLLMLEFNGKKIAEFFIYSLKEDLYPLLPLRGDFHGHSYRSDGNRDPAALLGHYREQGYDFMALTDHNRFYPGAEMDEAYEGVRLGITHLQGEEVHFPGSMIHTVHVGGSSSVTALYCKDEAKCRAEADALLEKVPAEVPEKYRERYSRLMWITDRIHEADGVAIFPHPYWKPGNRAFNVQEEFTRIILKSGMYDAYELIGCMGQVGVNFSVNLRSELLYEGCKMPVVGSSDVHAITAVTNFPHYFTVAFAKDGKAESIKEALRKGMTVAVEATGDEYARQYRCYGDLRLVYYAQFLLTNYFPQHQRICAGEGIAMRSYLMAASPAALIEAQAKQTEFFRDVFFGRTEPLLPNAEIKAFESKWREVQLAGPTGKGSAYHSERVTRQI